LRKETGVSDLKIVLIGVGSASFGRGTLADVFACEDIADLALTVVLVDTDPAALDRMHRFALLLKAHHRSSAAVEATTDRCAALPGADYVIVSVAQLRNELWDRDFYLPAAFGFKQVLGECGGPGGAFHTLRSLAVVVPIARDMERLCPDALLLNFTNPESRVCMGLSKLTEIQAVGLCHGAFTTRRTVARTLAREEACVEITIAGLNHFHWVTSMVDEAGAHLYPAFRQQVAGDPDALGPLTKLMFDTFGLLPFTSDDHIGEYVAFAYDAIGPDYTKYTEEVHAVEDQEPRKATVSVRDKIQHVVDGGAPLTEDLARPSAELAVPIICDTTFDTGRRELAVNIPNAANAISNLPEDAIVEVTATVDAAGLHPIEIGPLPEGIAAMCRTQISIQKLLVEAYEKNSRSALIQALAIDPAIDSIPRARQLVDEMLRVQASFLPQLH